jgi:hypothetical protein
VAFGVFGPTGHEILAQGLPWETRFNVASPHKALLRCALEKNTRRARVGGAEGATGISGRSRRPFRASGDRPKTQGKPWAKFSRPFGPEPLRGGTALRATEPRSTPNELSSRTSACLRNFRKIA